jgi:gliding motility-associated-like protein
MHKRYFISLLVCFVMIQSAWAQGIVNKGGNIVIKKDAFVVVKTNKGHYVNKNMGWLDIRNGGTLMLEGNWLNNSPNMVMKTNQGRVVLNGGAQTIGGFFSTGFSSLDIAGTANKMLLINTFTGGVYAGSKTGVLNLQNSLNLNSKRLIVNNGSPFAIKRTTGFLLSETDPISGYGEVQWNVRGSNNDSLYIFPFGTIDNQYIPLVLGVKNAGVQKLDSGFITVATYPTNASLPLNNRPLPTGVNNFMNQFGKENANMALDRFWVLQGDGFTTFPKADLVFSYRESEWDLNGGSTNLVDEKEMVAVKYDGASQKWEYPGFGFSDPTVNRVYTTDLQNYLGNWVLTQLPYCPVADYTTADRCYSIPFIFKDSSTIKKFTITDWKWDFGDGNSSVLKDPIHKYSLPGKYPVQLKVTGTQGCPDSIVYVIEAFTHPVASFDYKDTCFNQLTDLASTSIDTGYNITSALWSTSDGASLNGNNIKHRYKTMGSQFANLIVENEKGCRDTVLNAFEIRPVPRANFTTEPICENAEAEYFSSATTATGGLIKYRWDLPFGNSSTKKDTTFYYKQPGTYNIKHWVENNYGCIDSVIISQLVKPKVIADFDFNPLLPTIADPFVSFRDKSINASIWDWDLGEFGVFSTQRNPTHNYTDTGWFNVILIANNDVNCPDTASKRVYIKPVVKIWIPNAFTPVGLDLLNSTFRPFGVLSGITEYEMQIYNRWGELIFKTNDLDRPWDGTIRNGEVDCQAGAYLYIIRMIDLNRETYSFNGTVNLIR